VRLLLDSHPDLAVAPESGYLFRLAQRVTSYYGDLSTEEGVRKYVRDISQSPRVRDWFPESFDTTHLLHKLRKTGRVEARDILAEIYSQYASRRSKRVWGDKTPRNIEFFSEITALFPNAKFLIVVRDCRDVFLSLREVKFGKLSAASAALRWRNDARTACLLTTKYPDKARVIRYEDLLQKPKEVLPEILSFFELRGDVDLEALYLRHDDDVKHSKSSLYKQPISPKNLDRWRSKISPRDLTVCEAVAGPEMKMLGYELRLENPRIASYTLALHRIGDKISRLYNRTFLENYIGFSKLAARRMLEQVVGG
jgi:hypothetical protein